MLGTLEPIWWLSFSDDDGFRGACQIRAADEIAAVRKTHRLGINPGGETLIAGPLDEADVVKAAIPFDRLLQKNEIPEPVQVDSNGEEV